MAWSGDAEKVDVGPGKLWVAKLTHTAPTNATGALEESADLGIDGEWVPVGYTEEGSTFKYDVTSEGIEVAEELEEIASKRTKAVATLSFAMAEMTARNLKLALNGGLTPAPTSIGPIAASAEVRISLCLNTDAGARWYFPRAYSQGSIEVSNKKAPQKRLIPVEYKLEKPSAGESFAIWPNADGVI